MIPQPAASQQFALKITILLRRAWSQTSQVTGPKQLASRGLSQPLALRQRDGEESFAQDRNRFPETLSGEQSGQEGAVAHGRTRCPARKCGKDQHVRTHEKAGALGGVDETVA